MGFLSKYRGTIPIGLSMKMPDAENLLTMSDSSKWLRAGVFAAAASYPIAATIEHLKAISFSAPTTAPAINADIYASDDAGVIIGSITTATSADITRSTDGGLTWAAVTPGATGGINPHYVYRLNGKFWLIANDANNIYVAESVTGAAGTWTQRAVITASTNMTASTSRMDWSGTNFIVVTQTSTGPTNGIFTSPTGVVWTVRSAGLNNSGPSFCAAAATTGRVVASSSSGNYYYSSDHGVTWSAAIATPGSAAGAGCVWTVGDQFYFFNTTPGMYVATTPSAAANWTKAVLPTYQLSRLATGHFTTLYITRNAARTYAHTGVAYSGLLVRFDNAANIAIRRSNKNSFTGASGACSVVMGTTYSYAAANSVGAYAAANWDTFNAVAGQAISTPTSPNDETVEYTRVA